MNEKTQLTSMLFKFNNKINAGNFLPNHCLYVHFFLTYSEINFNGCCSSYNRIFNLKNKKLALL